MEHEIRVGRYRLAIVSSVTIKASVESLADTAVITLPAAMYNQALDIEKKVSEGDPVSIRFGYDKKGEDLPLEFSGYVESISADDGAVKIHCEDELYRYRQDLEDAVISDVTVRRLMERVNAEIGGFGLSCDYDFKYDRFTIYNATGFDVLKKIQQETKANIYLKGKTLHIHPQYSEVSGEAVYDFAVNIEKSDLKYKEAKKRKLICTVEGTDQAGKSVKVVKGTPGGDKFTLSIPGVSDRSTLERRAEEELKIRAYTGYEGTITGWLIPYVEPAMMVEIRDSDYEYKNGKYYVVAVETSFSKSGGVRKITLGKRIG